MLYCNTITIFIIYNVYYIINNNDLVIVKYNNTMFPFYNNFNYLYKNFGF